MLTLTSRLSRRLVALPRHPVRALSGKAVAPVNEGTTSVADAEAPEVDTQTISTFTGTPKGMLDTRRVKIFKPAQGVQNATQNTLVWKMQWEDEQTERWQNPLMGWTSTRDPLSNTHMTLEFQTSEEAARFAERNGEAAARVAWTHQCHAHRPIAPPQAGNTRSSSRSRTSRL